MKRISTTLLILAVFSFISAYAFAQDNGVKPGVLSGDKIRVRTGPSTSHKILTELRKGTKVNVIAKKSDWYIIEMPQDIILWISKTLVAVSSEGGKTTGVIKGEKVNVRTGIEASDVVVGQVNKGDKISIIGSKEGWYKIRPPKGFKAYVFAKYVKVDDSAGVTRDPVRVPDNTQDGGDEDDKYARRLAELNRQIEALQKESKDLNEILDKKKKKERELEEKLKNAEEIYELYKQQKEEIEKKYQGLIETLEKGSKPKPKYTAEGYVDDIGKLLNSPPATHRLFVTGGGEPRYYLVSADASINLDNYLRKRVGVEGEIVEKEWGDKKIEVIKVISIAILED